MFVLSHFGLIPNEVYHMLHYYIDEGGWIEKKIISVIYLSVRNTLLSLKVLTELFLHLAYYGFTISNIMVIHI